MGFVFKGDRKGAIFPISSCLPLRVTPSNGGLSSLTKEAAIANGKSFSLEKKI